LDDPDERSTAFAYMSLAQDAGFVVGPAAFGAVAVTVSPEVALACCSALIGAGGLIAATVAVRSRPVDAPSGRSGSLLRALATVAAVMAVLGVALDAVDVSTAAFASEHHHPQLAGVLLGCFSVGSIAGALLYGAHTWRSSLRTRLFGCSVALSILALGPVAAPSIALAAPIFVIAGLPLGATITTAFLLASDCAPSERQTESYALLSMTLNGGAALGGVLAGQLVTHGSARSGFLLAVASGLFTTALLALVSAGDRMRMFSSSPS
jgi:MFS family permease